MRSVRGHLSLFDARRAVEPDVAVAVVVEERLEHVEHARHLGEEEDAVAVRLEAPQQQVQGLQLA